MSLEPDACQHCRWNLFIKTDGYLDSFLNVGASLAIGSASVVSCPANSYVQGLAAVSGCTGFTALQASCMTSSMLRLQCSSGALLHCILFRSAREPAGPASSLQLAAC